MVRGRAQTGRSAVRVGSCREWRLDVAAASAPTSRRRPESVGQSRSGGRRRVFFAVALLALALLPGVGGRAEAREPASFEGLRIEGATWPVPLASEPLYDLEFVNMYAELYPQTYEASVLADVFLVAGATDPVVLQCQGNFKHLSIKADQPNLAFRHSPPYFWLYNITPGEHRISFTYRVRHDGFSTPGAIIAIDRLALDRTAFWYPRNIASDSHQVILNLVTDPGYAVYSDAELTRDIPNNLKRLRTFVIRKPSQPGLELRGTP